MKYEVQRTFGGYKIVDLEGNQVGDVYDGTGAMARAQEEADKLNAEPVVEESDEFFRGKGREGRGS